MFSCHFIVVWVTEEGLAALALCLFLLHSQCPAPVVEAAGWVLPPVPCCRSHSHCTSFQARGKAPCNGLGSHYIWSVARKNMCVFKADQMGDKLCKWSWIKFNATTGLALPIKFGSHQSVSLHLTKLKYPKCILSYYWGLTLTVAPWYSVGIGDWAISLSIWSQWSSMFHTECIHRGQRYALKQHRET